MPSFWLTASQAAFSVRHGLPHVGEWAMIDSVNQSVVQGAVAGVVPGLLVGGLLVQAGCALADVTVPRFFKALLLYGLTALLCAPLTFLLLWLAGRWGSPSDSLIAPAVALALGVALLVTWTVSAVIYTLFLAAPYWKGLMISGAELAMRALLIALATGIVMVVLAGIQAGRQPPPSAEPAG